MTSPDPAREDSLTTISEWLLAGLVLLAPLPFGSVPPSARLGLEIVALALVAIWVVRAVRHRVVLPPRLVCVGVAGLLVLVLVQAIPVPDSILEVAAPTGLEIRRTSELPPTLAEAEARMLGLDDVGLLHRGTLSVDPVSTASALRMGGMLAALLLVASSVSSVRSASRIALALLLSAAFQGLYGLLVVVSGHDRIWHVPKRYGLDAATGTFVNRNHFACLLALSLACGLGLILHNARSHEPGGANHRLVDWFSPARSRNLLIGLLLIVGTAGLFMSLSRAGILVGLLGLGWTAAMVRESGRARIRIAVMVLVTLIAILPLLQTGSDRMIRRIESTSQDLGQQGGRVTVWRDSTDIIAAFPAFGSGFGTFHQIYPLFRSAEVRKFYRHAHNDALQVVVEGGILGACLLLLLLIPVLRVVAAALRGWKGTLAVGYAAGLMAVLLHSLVDFPFRIPAVAATTTVVAGILLGLPWTEQD
jgi:O-antigen ligase